MPASNIVTPEHIDILEEDIAAKGAVSEALLRKIAAALNHANYYSALPLGTILENFIPPTQFFNLATNAWVRINGADITDTEYGQWLISQGLASGTVYLPDARGMELVGVNDGRSDGHQNSSNLSPGQFQDERLKSHYHKMFRDEQANDIVESSSHYASNRVVTDNGFGGWTTTSNDRIGRRTTNNEANVGRTSSEGSSQTNSKRIAVYRYIKVWNVAPDL